MMGSGVGAAKTAVSGSDCERAANLLAGMMKDKLNVWVSPVDLATFIRDNFSRISPLAHAIHDAEVIVDRSSSLLPPPVSMGEYRESSDADFSLDLLGR